MWPFSPLYRRVPALDAGLASSFDEKQECYPEGKNRNTKYFFILIVLANTLALGFLILFFGPQHLEACQPLSPSTSPIRQLQDCGSTVASAHAANCSFDLLSNSWMPNSCYDSETDLEFRSWIVHPNRTRGAWPYFTSSSLSPTTHVPDVETLSSMTGVWLWTTEEEHIAHCIFWARRIHRALEGRFRWSKGVENMQHTFHCAYEVLDNLLVKAPLRKVETGVVHFKVQFDTCA